LREDQIKFLKNVPNSAEIIRRLVDDYIVQSQQADITIILEKIQILQQKWEKIINSDFYKACRSDLRMDKMVKENPKIKTRPLFDPVTLELLKDVDVNSEEYAAIISKSNTIFNKLEAECSKLKTEIEKIQEQLCASK